MSINKKELPNSDYIDNDIINLLKSIGYKHRTGNYWILIEKDGYINVNYKKYNEDDKIIHFHKNYYFGTTPHYKDISEEFKDFDSFLDFITEYHNDLFFKHKIEKILNKI